MQIRSHALPAHLKKNGIASCYLIYGDDDSLREDMCQLVRDKLAAQGFAHSKRQVEQHFNWTALAESLQHQDLFNPKTSIECHHPKATFDATATDVLKQYCAKANNDQCLLIVCHKLTARQKKMAWYRAIEQAGVVVPVWPLNERETYQWIKTHCQEKSLTAEHAAIQLLAQYAQGRIFVAKQAIEKLWLWRPHEQITLADMQDVLCDHASDSPFEWVNDIMLGKHARALLNLHALRDSNQALTLVLWALTQQLRELCQIKLSMAGGQSLQEATAHIWKSKQQLLKSALQRIPSQVLKQAMQETFNIELSIKGESQACAWLLLEQLTLKLCQPAHAGKP